MTAGSQTLPEFLDGCSGRQVWVFGDLMLDEYVRGPVNRISPEAPVPVVRVEGIEYRMGGAANVAGQVAALGAHPVLAGAVGGDWAGERLKELGARAGIDTRCVTTIADRHTTRKLRVLGQGQQLLRLDWEATEPLSEEALLGVVESLAEGPDPEAIIVSDYAKGSVTPRVIARLAAEGVKCRLIDAYSFPFDERKLLAAAANKRNCILTVEDNYIGGLAGAVAEAAARAGTMRVDSMTCDRIPKSAKSPEAILEYTGLSPAHIERKIRTLLG